MCEKLLKLSKESIFTFFLLLLLKLADFSFVWITFFTPLYGLRWILPLQARREKLKKSMKAPPLRRVGVFLLKWWTTGKFANFHKDR